VVPVILDDDVAGLALHITRLLPGQQTVGFFPTDVPIALQTGAPDSRRSVDQDNEVERGWIGGLEQQRDVVNDHLGTVAARGGFEHFSSCGHRRVDQTVEVVKRVRIALVVVAVVALIGLVLYLAATPGSIATERTASGALTNREAFGALIGLMVLGMAALGLGFRDLL